MKIKTDNWINLIKHILLLFAVVLIGCNPSSKTIVNKQKIDLQFFPDSILAFTFNPSQKLNMCIYNDRTDPLKLLQKVLILNKEINVGTMVQFDKVLFKEFYDSVAIFNSIPANPNYADCGFNPHHCILYMDKNNTVKSYELICYLCADRRAYGKKLKKYGSLQTYFRFFQFHGLSKSFGLEALHQFGTQAEIDCQRLRTFPGEILKCQ